MNNSLVKHIPNFLTLCNLLCGMLAIFFSLSIRESFSLPLFFLFLCLLFDFLDGFSARLFSAQSAIGVELDSLSDLVSFGVAPIILVLGSIFRFSYIPLGNIFLAPKISAWIFIFFLFPILSAAYRLARFNIQHTASDRMFKGLPVPSNALVWIGFSFLVQKIGLGPWFYVLLIFFSLFTSILMISRFPFMSLKFEHFDLKDKNLLSSLIVWAILFLITFLLYLFLGGFALSCFVFLFFIVSLFEKNITQFIRKIVLKKKL